jgi:hypothetical protein
MISFREGIGSRVSYDFFTEMLGGSSDLNETSWPNARMGSVKRGTAGVRRDSVFDLERGLW